MSKKLTELATEATENQLAVQIRESATQVRESATQIWLAGLGAFSKAQQEGVKMFEALVAEGEKFQERTKTAADERLAEVREKATETWDKLEKVFEDPSGARAARLERSEPQGYRRPVEAGPRTDGGHQEDVGGGRAPHDAWPCAQSQG